MIRNIFSKGTEHTFIIARVYYEEWERPAFRALGAVSQKPVA